MGYIENLFLCYKYLKNPTEVIVKFIQNKEVIAQTKIGFNFRVYKGSGNIAKYLKSLYEGWELKYDEKNKEFICKKDNIKLIQPDPGVLCEPIYDTYIGNYDLNNKIVLDVGGYRGETSIFFIKLGLAKKVIVYEPVSENIKYIKKNIILNKLEKNITLNEYGVNKKNGKMVINSSSQPGNSAFGLPGNKYKLEINVKSWDIILKNAIKNSVYLAKVDCEGGEEYLLNVVDKELIKKIPIWIIETHSKVIEKNILNLFYSLNYKKFLKEKLNSEVKIYEFKRD